MDQKKFSSQTHLYRTIKSDGDMSGLRSNFGAFQPNNTDAEQIKRDGWNEQRILVVAVNDERLDFVDREFISRIGERLYGGSTAKKGKR